MELKGPTNTYGVCASLEILGVWRVCVTQSLNTSMETRLQKVSSAMSSVFSCLHRANETLCARCATHLGHPEGKFGPNNRLSSSAR